MNLGRVDRRGVLRNPLATFRGVTIVEVVVSISVVAVLVSLLIPAVQQARAAAARSRCQNNLRQIGVALHHVCEETGVFPVSSKPHSPYWRLLPYLEQRELYDRLVDFKARPPMPVPVLECPLDSVVSNGYGNVSYYFNDGSRFRTEATVNGFRDRHSKKDTSPADCSDGLSNTAAMAERLVGYTNSTIKPSTEELEKDAGRAFWYTQVRFNQPGDESKAIVECTENRTTIFPQGYSTGSNGFGDTMGYDHMLPPNRPACYNGPEDFEIEAVFFLIPASSLHNGGVNVLMGDGGVHFVGSQIDADVWRAIGSRNGQENVSIPF